MIFADIEIMMMLMMIAATLLMRGIIAVYATMVARYKSI